MIKTNTFLKPTINDNDPLSNCEFLPQSITQFTLSNNNITIKLLNYGATLSHFIIHNPSIDIVLGFDDPFDYVRAGVSHNIYLGAIIGRSCNRTANGSFSLNKTSYTLPINNGPNSLHGGEIGFDKRIWSAHIIHPSTVVFELVSIDGDQGYPATLHSRVTYTLTNNSLEINYTAHLSPDTPNNIQTYVNLTNHSYFNLNPSPSLSIKNHLLSTHNIHGVLDMNQHQIPNGHIILPSQSHVFDFPSTHSIESTKSVGECIESLPDTRGYDHFFVRNDLPNSPKSVTNFSSISSSENPSLPIVPLVTVYSPISKLVLTIKSNAPGFQLYTGNWINVPPSPLLLNPKPSTHPRLDTQSKVNGGNLVDAYSGMCFETSAPPDSISVDAYKGMVIVGHGSPYHQTTIYSIDMFEE